MELAKHFSQGNNVTNGEKVPRPVHKSLFNPEYGWTIGPVPLGSQQPLRSLFLWENVLPGLIVDARSNSPAFLASGSWSLDSPSPSFLQAPKVEGGKPWGIKDRGRGRSRDSGGRVLC